MIYFCDKKVKNIYFGQKKVKKIYIGQNLIFKSSVFPELYQPVEYLESTGTQYIELDYKRVVDDYVELVLAPTYATGDRQFFGHYASVTELSELGQLNGKFRGNIGDAEIDIVAGQKYTVTNINGKWNIDGQGISRAFNVDSSLNDYLFARNSNGTANKLNSCKVFSLKISRNGIVIFCFVPCYRKLDNKPGMYDLVNDVFYTNNGTGEFIVGGDV